MIWKTCKHGGELVLDCNSCRADPLAAELSAATERNGNLSVELAAMTQERDALRREVALKGRQIRLMAIRCALYCSVSECCPKQPVSGRFDMETCYKCQAEKYQQKATEQAGKVGEV